MRGAGFSEETGSPKEVGAGGGGGSSSLRQAESRAIRSSLVDDTAAAGPDDGAGPPDDKSSKPCSAFSACFRPSKLHCTHIGVMHKIRIDGDVTHTQTDQCEKKAADLLVPLLLNTAV